MDKDTKIPNLFLVPNIIKWAFICLNKAPFPYRHGALTRTLKET